MFKIGDYIIYEGRGVCRVEHVGPLSIAGAPSDRMYYTLSSCSSIGSTVYTPVDNTKVLMRALLTRAEAEKLVDDMLGMDILWIPDEKRRESEYKDALSKCDCVELVKMIKTIYLRRQARLLDGKKNTSVDEKYFRLAEDCLYGELAIALDMDRDKVADYLVSRLDSASKEEKV